MCDARDKFTLGSCSSFAAKTSGMTVDVYLAPASGPCRAVLMTAQYLGVDVRQKVVNLMTGDQLKPDFLKVSGHRFLLTLSWVGPLGSQPKTRPTSPVLSSRGWPVGYNPPSRINEMSLHRKFEILCF